MFLDARWLDDGSIIKTTVCIIGGGTAGITLALEFGKKGVQACVLESGGFRPDPATRDLYRGENVGVPYRFADGSRSRFLGGSSNCWGGWCRPLDEHDFAQRDWVPYSGWPITKSELLPYYDRSQEVLRLGPNRYDAQFWTAAIARPDVRRIPFVTDDVIDAISQFSPPLRFGKFYRTDLAKSTNVTVILHANAINIETDTDCQRVEGVTVATLTGRFARVTAAFFILAAGGIENARLLLASNKIREHGLGNEHDLVGRFFMDHVQLYYGNVLFRDAWSQNMLYNDKLNYHNRKVAAYDTCVAAQLMLNPSVQAREKILNAQIWFSSILPGEDSRAVGALIRMKRRFEQREPPGSSIGRDLWEIFAHPMESSAYALARHIGFRSLARGCRFHSIVEPVPDPESRVTLSEARDQLGMNRVKVAWRLDPLVRRTFDRTNAIIAHELSAAGVADVLPEARVEEGAWPGIFSQEGTWHHIGTTRMHDSPKLGVVDRDCRVHRIGNLYVSGSSVFPTSGGNFPTITIVALALRLADHIAEQLSVSLCCSRDRGADPAKPHARLVQKGLARDSSASQPANA